MLKMFRANDEDFKKMSSEISYWSNGAGELSHRGEYDISADDLPDKLKRVYNDLWSDEFGSICYLAETARGFGIALVKEYDETLAADHNLTMGKLYDCIVKDGLAVANHPYFGDFDVIIGEHSGFADCHELIVFFPSDISKNVFRTLAQKLDEIAYSSLPAPKRDDQDRVRKWEEKFLLLKEFIAEHERLPKQHESFHGVRIGAWCNDQKNKIKSGIYPSDRHQKLKDIGFFDESLSPNEKQWNDTFLLLEKFVSEFNRFPTTQETYHGVNLGRWCSTQKAEAKSEELSSVRRDKLDSIGFISFGDNVKISLDEQVKSAASRASVAQGSCATKESIKMQCLVEALEENDFKSVSLEMGKEVIDQMGNGLLFEPLASNFRECVLKDHPEWDSYSEFELGSILYRDYCNRLDLHEQAIPDSTLER